ncbi:MAG: UDP-N-acetylmuramoyl-L-alanyl-D-glutamate--2,6-diaminopimelate ligase [Phycisphaerae bacterium]|nr:UDP-N-acetylmuramoyl-L-alanyl-D-glutamate--2,6-diaminopimelate ligase [Phycisphaerae bacterium]
MRLDELIKGVDAITTVIRRPTERLEVRRVVSDSRQVQRGDAFCAIVGHDADGHKFVPAAIAAGAAAIIVQTPLNDAPVPQVVLADTRKAIGWLAHRCLGDPSRGMTVVGVTGTKGKTTITYLLESIFKAAGRTPGVLGTIAYRLGPGKTVELGSHVTTPGAPELAEMFAAMRADGIRDVVMEVSSHALDQDRVAGIDFSAAVFTNLAGDHRDYHPTVEHYLNAKARLFESLRPDAAAIVNRDTSAGEQIARRTKAAVTWFGLSGAADVSAQIVQINTGGSRINLLTPGHEPVPVQLPLIGRHNVSNSLAAAAAMLRLGVPLETIVAGLESAPQVPGRLEPVLLPGGAQPAVTVLVDYAHTDDALDNVLSALRPMVGAHKLICVFGCGGDRDRTKRPRMAAVAERWADVVIVTSDNPRTEQPEAIIDEIMAGFSVDGSAKASRQANRRVAIELALKRAAPGDAVLIAGKGHETYQIIGKERKHFDDREVAAEVLAKRLA